MTLLAAFDVLLQRYTGQDDLVVGSPIANRTREELEELIGFFVNSLVMRADLSGDPSFVELLAQARQGALSAYQHQDLPFERLVEELEPERELNRNPIFQVMFAVQNAPEKASAASGTGLTIGNFPLKAETTRFDLEIHITEDADHLHVSWLYATDLFDRSTIEQMARHYVRLLEGIVEGPQKRISELPMLSEEERRQVLREWNATGVQYPRDASVVGLFEEQVRKSPNAVALVFGEERISYGELNERANRLAHYLRELGVQREELVGLCLERSIEMVVGVLGILKAGGAYVPMDPQYPKPRLAFMLKDIEARVLLTTSGLRAQLPVSEAQVVCLDTDAGKIEKQSGEDLGVERGPRDLAYIIYTSGSTGEPKGSSVEQRSIVRLVKNTNYVQLGPEEVLLQFAPISFDASTLELWGSLLNGARLEIFPPHTPTLEELGGFIEERGVTTLWLTAALFQQMVDHQLERLKGVRQMLAGGEALSVPHVKKYLGSLTGDRRLINGYGPTENTTFTCCHVMGKGSEIGRSVPIGKPIANTRVYVLDERREPVPVGVAGELYAGGDGVARGYHRRAELTAEKFVPDPFSEERGARLYRTGDVVRWLRDGTIEFLGRADTQVKVRGFRIELGEIEAALASHPAVREAVVLAREDSPGEKRLVAYVVAGGAKPIPREELRACLKERLPEYMVPSAFVMLDGLPLTPNGKVDRKKLPSPAPTGSSGDHLRGPQTQLELQLTAI